MSKSDRGALSKKHMLKSLAESERQQRREYDMQKHPERYPDAAVQNVDHLNKFMETLE